MRRLILIQTLLLLLVAHKAAHASPYIEAGTSLGKASNVDEMVENSLGTLSSGFVGSLSIYFPVTSMKHVTHFELGLQNRFTTFNGSTGSAFMLTPHLSARIEFWRFFVGAGYAPKVLIDFKPKQGASAYYGEGGLIWRVVPEFQICAAIGIEYGTAISGARSPNPSMEYGLRFRFPLDPKEYGGASAVDWDGFRYPFGIMR